MTAHKKPLPEPQPCRTCGARLNYLNHSHYCALCGGSALHAALAPVKREKAQPAWVKVRLAWAKTQLAQAKARLARTAPEPPEIF